MNPPAKPESSFKRHARFAISLAISIACLVYVLRYVDLSEILNELSRARPEYVFGAILVTTLSYFIRAARWPFFFDKNAPKFFDSYRCLIIGFFMNNVLPARMGEFVRAHIGGRTTGESRAVILATIAGERLADGVAISLVFSLLFLTSDLGDPMLVHREHFYFSSLAATNVTLLISPFLGVVVEPPVAFFNLAFGAGSVSYASLIAYVAYFFFAAVLGVFTLLAFRNPIFKGLEHLSAVLPGHLSTYSLGRARLFIQGLEPLLHKKKLVVLSFFSALVWSVELVVFYLVARAFDQDLSLAELSLFLAAVNFSSLIPAAPGGIGVIELITTLTLVSVGVGAEKAFSMVAVQHVIQYAVVGLPGAFFFFSRLGGRIPTSEEEEVEEQEPDTAFELSSERAGRDALFLSEPAVLDFSIVIPAYNEAERLPRTLHGLFDYWKARAEKFEVIVVNDGSSDNTAEIVQSLSVTEPAIKLLTYSENQGKGYAVRMGVQSARGALVLFCDADGATPHEEIERLEKLIYQGADVAIGSRALFSPTTQIKTAFHRKFLGRMFNALVNVLVLPGIADTQCGFKLFRRPAARYVFNRQRSKGFSFDVEVLLLSRIGNFSVAEVPVNWVNVEGSKVNLVTDSFKMLIDIFRFRFYQFVGLYRK